MLPIRDVNPTAIRPLFTWGLILANVIVFFSVQPQESPDAERFMYEYAAIACELTTGHPLDLDEVQSGECREEPRTTQPFPDKQVYLSVFSSMFLHAGIAHLLLNMWVLFIFGNNVEEAFGHVAYMIFYVAAGVAATVGFVALNADLTIPLVGASGAIAGVMGAYFVLFPRHVIMTLILFRIVGIPAMWFLGIWLVSQFLIAAEETNIAWEAHVAGFLFGAAVAVLFRDRLLARTLESQGTPAAERSFGF